MEKSLTHDVSLLAMTKPMPLAAGPLNSEEWLAFIARVSNPKNENNNATAPKLVKYLANNHHWSPFEMISIVMSIYTTRDIGRQILRHRSFAFQEFSQRYANPTELGFQNRDARLQDTKNRQNSIETEDEALHTEWQKLQTDVQERASSAYSWALQHGIAKEQARVVLPEGMTMSRMYMAGTLRSWIHYCQLRCANGTQKEHQLIAKDCWKLISKEFPSLKELVQI